MQVICSKQIELFTIYFSLKRLIKRFILSIILKIESNIQND